MAASSHSMPTANTKPKMKCVVRITLKSDKSRRKAMEVAVRAAGVESVGFIGEKNDELEMVGDGVNWPELAIQLGKKVGPAEQLSLVQMPDYGACIIL